MTNGRLYVISAPSGAGKNSIIRLVMKEVNNLVYSISVTTRLPRNGEAHGKDYFFVTRDEFRGKITNNDFLEWAEVHGEFYGTLRSHTEEIIKSGRDVILDIDIQGARSVKANMKEAVCIFIMPPSLQELRKRLLKRGTETREKIEERLIIAEHEMESSGEYDYIVVNSVLSEAVADVKKIIDNT